ncbi:hypothetical protein [Fulvivirga ligni]|uniref:hypothetical protein n=1 Tax=Fulvivirga ligni TaxID=2904246 RepID=UPI001F2197F2|nr:hypothetical protein [Fulvivirga ligni]UII19945.1 hypothetical protein LVD16_19055 [Fulvivirga ligni]
MEDLITENAVVKHEESLNALFVELKGYIPLETLKSVIEREYAMIKHYKLSKCLVDLRGIKVYAPGAQELVKTEWFPTVKSLGVKQVAIIIPEDIFGKLAMEKAHEEQTKTQDKSTQNFKDIESAKEWLANDVLA